MKSIFHKVSLWLYDKLNCSYVHWVYYENLDTFIPILFPITMVTEIHSIGYIDNLVMKWQHSFCYFSIDRLQYQRRMLVPWNECYCRLTFLVFHTNNLTKTFPVWVIARSLIIRSIISINRKVSESRGRSKKSVECFSGGVAAAAAFFRCFFFHIRAKGTS